MYKINPFLIHDLINGEVIVQTNNSTVLISNVALIKLLRQIENDNLETISDEWLSGNEYNEEMLSFLLSNKILIETVNISSEQIGRIICCTDNFQFKSLFQILFASKYKLVFINTKECYEHSFNKDDLCIIFLEPFLYSDFLKLDDCLKEKNVLSKFVFYYNYSIYISNFYKNSWHIPCPKCFFSSLENHLRGNQITETMNFQLLIDLIYRKKLEFPIQANLHCYDLILLMYLLQIQLASFNARENYIIYELCEITLQTNKLIKDQAIYWEICDCYE